MGVYPNLSIVSAMLATLVGGMAWHGMMMKLLIYHLLSLCLFELSVSTR